MKSKLLLSLLGIFFINCISAQEVDTKVPYKIGGSTKKAFKETKKVAIGFFGITQHVQTSASSTGGGGGAFAKMTVNFGGVDIAAYQAVVKEAYDFAVTKLKGLGYEVMTPEELKATGEPTYVPDNAPKSFKTNSGTVVAINVQPQVPQLEMDMTPMGSNPMIKKAKSINAILMNFEFGASAVSFERGSRLSKKAKVSASPWLTLGGNLNTYPIGKTASPAVISIAVKDGYEDFAGPEGLYETSSNHSPWLGSAKGKYVLDIDQTKYLVHVKNMLMAAVDKGIAKWHEEITD